MRIIVINVIKRYGKFNLTGNYDHRKKKKIKNKVGLI